MALSMGGSLPEFTLTGKLPAKTVQFTIGRGCIDRLGELLGDGSRGTSVELVTDRNVAALFARRAERSLRRAGWRVCLHVLPTGESVKSVGVIKRLHERWFESGYDRHTPVIALGGGTITDALGFAAATFMRGLPLWFVPTTIVGQVDAAIGGKVGINHRRGKNLIGVFYHPVAVAIDPELLRELPERDRRAGLAEVIKYGMIADPKLFRRCERNVGAWIGNDRTLDAAVIKRCVKIKSDIVAIDESDLGLRHLLNFGHTLGHAFERWGGYRRLRHGEAVALGMVGVSWIARQRGLFPAEDFQRLADLCQHLVPRRRRPAIPVREIRTHLSFDKKRRSGRNVWILPERIGQVTILDDITQREVGKAVNFVNRWLASG
jgi:3-dehydroquinate synthase